MLPLFLLFTITPLVELWLLFQLSGMFGFWTTIFVVLATGALGAVLARWQGWRALHRVQTEMRQGMLPTEALGDGALILVAGVLLITPGVLTDVLGLSLLVPPLRFGIRKGIQLWLAKHVQIQTNSNWQGPREVYPEDSNVVEGRVVDARVVDSDPEGPAK
ncbi:MAG: FxsA family protein [Planctomycetes bacterium]|nr:FxsA family protein [Planctomycetota bacterium]